MTIVLVWSIKYLRTERKVPRSNPWWPWPCKGTTLFTHHSRGAIYPPQKHLSHQTQMTQFSSRHAGMTQSTKWRICSHVRHEYGIVRSSIHRITDMGV
ncbi:hypothetical protein TNCV_1626341 [Trichonephila clavipes]|nr:hypothetical protein TNCV_1626341 [Trichonephila clavipes]